jgi:uncharacterized protein (DUF1800 family)
MTDRLAALMADPERAWAEYQPSANAPWDLDRVAHLHRRAGFAASWPVLLRDREAGPSASIDRLLQGEPRTPDDRPVAAFQTLTEEMARRLADSASLTRLQALWLYRMIFTPHPLQERMTMFWHNHFATSMAKVQDAGLLWRQNQLFRRHALGDFATLLAEVGRDPAMLIWLDSTENRKTQPNENYAREVMELFALGRGKYTEKDVQEAARAFTGWFVRDKRFVEVASQHDGGTKTVLGRSGALDGDDIPGILLDQPACAEFLCGKLARAFVTEVDPISPALLAPLARSFRESRYNIAAPLSRILRSNLFHDAGARRRRVKSPVELAVGTIRALEIFRPTVQADALAESCVAMGQSLFAPPSVAGWEGGPSWINSTAMLARNNLALALLGRDNPGLGGRFDPAALVARHATGFGTGSGSAPAASRFFADLLVQDAFGRDLKGRLDASSTDPRAAATLTAPEYQLA